MSPATSPRWSGEPAARCGSVDRGLATSGSRSSASGRRASSRSSGCSTMRAARRDRSQVDVFEPHPAPVPGRSTTRASRLPADELRRRPDRPVAGGQRRFRTRERGRSRDWRATRGGGGARYPPRALVGAYLADGSSASGIAPPARASIAAPPPSGAPCRRTARAGRRRRRTVPPGLRRGPDRGRARWLGRRLARRWPHAAGWCRAVFPVDAARPRSRAARGRVAVRGFALTFLDAALALTEGREAPSRADGPSHTGCATCRLRTTARVLLPFSRTGRPMLAKPEPGLRPRCPSSRRSAARARAASGRSPARLDSATTFCRSSPATAAAASSAADRRRPRAEHGAASPGRRLPRGAGGAPAPTAAESDGAFAGGRRRPRAHPVCPGRWATLAERLPGAGGAPRRCRPLRRGHGRRFAVWRPRWSALPSGHHPSTPRSCSRSSRAGVVDLSSVAGGSVRARAAPPLVASAADEPRRWTSSWTRCCRAPARASRPAAPRGAPRRRSGPRRDGPPRAGVNDDATCVGGMARRARASSAIGRPTEDCVIGNDTLNRSPFIRHRIAGRGGRGRRADWPRDDRAPADRRACAPDAKASCRLTGTARAVAGASSAPTRTLIAGGCRRTARR